MLSVRVQAHTHTHSHYTRGTLACMFVVVAVGALRACAASKCVVNVCFSCVWVVWRVSATLLYVLCVCGRVCVCLVV